LWVSRLGISGAFEFEDEADAVRVKCDRADRKVEVDTLEFDADVELVAFGFDLPVDDVAAEADHEVTG
jgi:hypothetical protein